MIFISHSMRTIRANEFFEHFIKISQNLTMTELQMLYILITEHEVIELSQQGFADRLGTHRRTINIGLKKLRQLKYIGDISIEERNRDATKRLSETNYKGLYAYEIQQAKKFILDALNEYYYPFEKKSPIVNADFYSSIIGDHRLPDGYRYNKNFISETIVEKYPNCKLHFKLRATSYSSENYYNISRTINNEITKSSFHFRPAMKKDKILQDLFEKYSIDEEEAMQVIKQEFPKLRFNKNKIIIPKPWQGRKSH